MVKRVVNLLLVFSLIFMVTITGCAPKTQKTSNTSGTKTKGGTVKYAIWSAPKGVFLPSHAIDAYDSAVNEVVYEGLLKLNPKYELETTGLAKSYEVSSDSKTITFKLNENVKWHDGKPFTAEDVKFTFEFYGNADYTGPYGSRVSAISGAAAFKKKQAQSIEGIKVIDQNTISITTDDVYGSALLVFGTYLPIIPKHIWESVDPKKVSEATDLLRNPVGTGPFKMSKFVPDQYVELTANDDYWKGRPNIDKLIYMVSNQDTAQAQIMKGEINILNISSPSKSEIDLLKNSKIDVNINSSFTYQAMVMNNESEVFKDKKVRQAFAYAINREGMVKDLLEGYSTVATNPYPSFFWAYPASGLNEYKYDSKKAIDLLKQSGWEYKESEKLMYRNGQPVKFTLKYPSGDKSREKAAAVIQQNLKDIGIQVDLQLLDFNTTLSNIQAGDYQIALMGMGSSNGDADISQFYHSSALSQKSSLNLSRLNNSKVDELLDKGRKILKSEDRKPIYNQLSLLLNDEQPMVYLYFSPQGRACSNNLKGVNMGNGSATYNINEWYFEK